ncbi:zinc finger MYND domain-containing protein [Phanerochaete sordida]|uniref:Zinc finger MYND domain-containing protein n=1 Tax=Phanerochaete sordida TaxID=48140 RepID=A0A9P3LFA0_9APHY|nr:zinc finger MYND domain-containing protein [Phanerochaete sordida]
MTGANSPFFAHSNTIWLCQRHSLSSRKSRYDCAHMLTRWHHIFPDESPYRWEELSKDAVQERLYRFPGAWPDLALEACEVRGRTRHDAELMWQRFVTLKEVVRTAPREVWHEAWAAGLVRCLAGSLGSNLVGGYTSAELIWPGTPDISPRDAREHIIYMVEAFLACVARVFHDDDREEVEQMLDIFQDTLIGVYIKLWDIRYPFLIGELSERKDAPENTNFVEKIARSRMDLMLNNLATLGRWIAEKLRDHRAIQLVESRVAHIFFLAWLYGLERLTRAHALSHLGLVNEENTARPATWKQLFASLLSQPGIITESVVTGAILRDLADECVVDKHLSNTLSILNVWQENWLLDGAVFSEPKLAGYCIGAARRQLCRGDHTDSERFPDIMEAVLMSIVLGATLSLKQCYGLLELFCRFAAARLERPLGRTPEMLNGYLGWILEQMRARIADARPRTVALRLHAHSAWVALTDELAHRGLAQRDADWRAFVRRCETVRRLIEPEPGASGVGAFAPLARCAWAACLCSVAAPAHRMRVCTGCGSVAYCGRECQERDWNEGGHRHRCQKLSR